MRKGERGRKGTGGKEEEESETQHCSKLTGHADRALVSRQQ